MGKGVYFFVFLCLAAHSSAYAATVNVVPDSDTLSVGGASSALVSGVDFPETGGAGLALTFNANVINVTGIVLAPGSPFSEVVPSSIDNVCLAN